MTTTEKPTLVVRSDRLHTGGGLRKARAEAKRTGLPVQHMNSNGSVTIVWIAGDREPKPGRWRQKTYPSDRVQVEFV